MKPRDRTFTSYCLFNHTTTIEKILKIAFNYIYNANESSAKINTLKKNHSYLLPPKFNHLITYSSKIYTGKMTYKFLQERWENEVPPQYRTLLKFGQHNKWNNQTFYTRMLTGILDFTLDEICPCKFTPNSYFHLIFHCPLFENERNYHIEKAQQFKMPLNRYILRFPQIIKPFLKTIFSFTHQNSVTTTNNTIQVN